MSSKLLVHPNVVWTNPESEEGNPSLVCLKPDAVCLAIVPAKELEKSAHALLGGGDLAAQDIPLKTITQLQGNQGDNDLSITYMQGESQTESVTITLADNTKRDQLLAALKARLGPEWESEERPVSRWSACRWPLSLTVVATVVAWVMYDQAKRVAAGEHLRLVGRNGSTKLFSAPMHWVEGFIGVTGVLILGGLLIALCLLWVLIAVAGPPVRFTVRPKKTGA
jgi:hypothetical protein